MAGSKRVWPKGRKALGLGLLVSAMALGAPGGAAAAGFEPQEFEVEVDMKPDIDPGEPDCVPDGGDMVCTMSMDYAVTGKEYKGKVSNASRNLAGDITMTCDMDMRNRMVTQFPYNDPGKQDVREFSGGGTMGCSWLMEFSEGSTLGGTITGKFTHSKVEGSDPPKGRMDGDFSVDVVSGTGVFESAIGSGSFADSNEFPLGGPPPKGARGSVKPARAGKAAAEDDGAMKLKLGKGRARAAIIAPAKLKSSDKRSLRVASARGATCRATATKGARKVSLGSARDSDKDGAAELKGALARKLGKGTWQIASSCTYTAKGKRVATAPAKKAVRVV